MENNKIFYYIKMEEIENNEKINNIKVIYLINIPESSNNYQKIKRYFI